MTRQYRFGNWLFDADTHRLCDGESDLTLEPRVARLLEFLLTHPQEMLSHDCLIEAVWDGRVVSDEAVRRAMSALRHALARDGMAAELPRTAAPSADQTATTCPPADLLPVTPPGRKLVPVLIGAIYLLVATIVVIALGHAVLLNRF